MRRLAGLLRERFRQLPKTTLAGLLLVSLLVSIAGLNGWAHHHFQAARAAMRGGHFEEARAHIQCCLRVWWFSGDAHLLAARIERLAGNFDQAAAHLQKCQKLIRPATEPLQLEWLLLRAQGGEVEEVAPGLLDVVLKHNHPESLLILETLVRAGMKYQRYHLAQFCLQEWLKREPNNVRAVHWRAFCWQQLGNTEEALKDYRRALELDPGLFDARIRLVDMLLASGSPLDALPHLELLAQSQPNKPEVLVGLARCRQLQGKLAEARRLIERVRQTAPDYVGGLYYQGEQELLEGKVAAAEETFKQLLKKDPYSLRFHRCLQACLIRQRDREEEVVALGKKIAALEKDLRRLDQLMSREFEKSVSNQAAVAAEIGEILLRLGNEEKGLYWLEGVALKRDANDRHANEVLATHYEAKGNTKFAAFHRSRAAAP